MKGLNESTSFLTLLLLYSFLTSGVVYANNDNLDKALIAKKIHAIEQQTNKTRQDINDLANEISISKVTILSIQNEISLLTKNVDQLINSFQSERIELQNLEAEHLALSKKLDDANNYSLITDIRFHVALISLLGGALVTIALYRISLFKEKRRTAVEYLNEFLTQERFLKARLLSQEYLMPNGENFYRTVSDDGNNHLYSMSELPAKLNTADKDANYYIRLLPSFFYQLNQAREKGLIPKDTKLFHPHYAWYWIHVIRFRLADGGDARMFRFYDWLFDEDQFQTCIAEYDALIENLDDDQKARWKQATVRSINAYKEKKTIKNLSVNELASLDITSSQIVNTSEKQQPSSHSEKSPGTKVKEAS